MAATDAKYFPVKNAAFRCYFTIVDNDGDLVTGAVFDSGLASGSGKVRLNKDGAAAVNSTNSVVEVDGGWYYVELTSGEMNYTAILVVARTTTTDAKNTPILLATDAAQQIADVIAGATTTAAIAEAIMSLDIATLTEASMPDKGLYTAVAKAVNRVRDNSGSLEIYRTDGTTVHVTQTLTTDAAAVPIKEQGGAS